MRSLAFGVVALLLLGACTPAPPQPSPSPTVSPSPSSSPPETELQRQERLDYEAAELAYRTFNAELNRVLQAGGAKAATATMKRTAAGPYLAEFGNLAVGFRENNAKQVGERRITTLVRAGYSKDELLLRTCEDSRSAVLFRAGKRVGQGDIREGNLTVRRIDGHWRVWSGEGRKVDQC